MLQPDEMSPRATAAQAHASDEIEKATGLHIIRVPVRVLGAGNKLMNSWAYGGSVFSCSRLPANSRWQPPVRLQTGAQIDSVGEVL